MLSIFFHNYYGNDQQWITYFTSQFTLPFNLFYNCVSDAYNRVSQADGGSSSGLQEVLGDKGRLFLRNTPNKGKDIGGKLVLLDAYLRLGIRSDYLLFLHDKHSPYHSNSQQWQKDLFRIAQREYLDQVLRAFRSDPEVGIVASRNAIRNESDNDQGREAYTESGFIAALKDKYGIRPPGLQYAAGTMFWVKASLYEEFFASHSPLEIRATLEEGNVLDNDQPTHTHAWERLLSWLVTSQGYKIKGV